MKRVLLFLLSVSVLAPYLSNAQFDEIGILAGTSNYSGDLTERTVEPLEFSMAQGIYLRRQISKQFGLKVQLARMVISGDDRNNPVESDIWQRGLNFRSDLYELGLQAEWVPIRLSSGENQFEPYLFAGVAGFYFNPRTQLDGQTYELQHFRTEGVDYSLYQV